MDNTQQRALVALLEDGDEATVRLVRDELIQKGGDRLTEYRTLRDESEGQARRILGEVIETIETAQNLGAISRLLAGLETNQELENLCWELAKAEHPGFEAGPYARQLDSWGESLRAYLAKEATASERVRAMTQFLATEQRLIGNHTDYYHPRNCFLPWVIEFRQGLPITLTLLYILIGERTGMKIDGLNAPGHFLARHEDIVFDPYHGGRVLSQADWEHIVADMPPGHLETIEEGATPAQIAHRLLLNLRNAYIKREDEARQKRIDHYLAVLQR